MSRTLLVVLAVLCVPIGKIHAEYSIAETLRPPSYLLPRPKMRAVLKELGVGALHRESDEEERHSYSLRDGRVLECNFQIENRVEQPLVSVLIKRAGKQTFPALPRHLANYDFKGVDLGSSMKDVLTRWGTPFTKRDETGIGPLLGLGERTPLLLLLYVPEPTYTGRFVKFYLHDSKVVGIAVTNR